MTVTVIRADARHLPLEDNSVDLVVTSPPYFALRSYQDGGEHYAGQVGAEATPAEFVDALLEVTRECVRVLKPSGSMWVNLGDKYVADNRGSGSDVKRGQAKHAPAGPLGFPTGGMRQKSLMGIPWRYALRCIDDLGLILRAEVIWSKPNGLPESVTDRVRRSHETWFHFSLQPRYFSAVDEIREAHEGGGKGQTWEQRKADPNAAKSGWRENTARGVMASPTAFAGNPLGKLPGSVWTVPTEPLRVPEHLGVDHFAAFPSEWPRRIVQGWSPSGVCTGCGEGRRPLRGRSCEECGALVEANTKTCLTCGHRRGAEWREGRVDNAAMRTEESKPGLHVAKREKPTQVSNLQGGYACACPDTTAPTTPAVVLDPFGGTGTTAHVASALGRHGISVDLSADYCRLAEAPELRDTRRRKVLGIDKAKPEVEGQADLFDGAA